MTMRKAKKEHEVQEPRPDTAAAGTRLRGICKRLVEPPNYFRGVGISRAGLPANILCLHRWPHLKISDVHTQARNLFHSRYALTLNLKEKGVICINEKSIVFPSGCAYLTYPYQSHCYLVDQNEFDWLVITFQASTQLPPDLMYRSILLSPFCFLLVEHFLEIYLELEDFDEQPPARVELLQQLLLALLQELRVAPVAKPQNSTKSPAAFSDTFALFEQLHGFCYQHINAPDLSLKTLSRQFHVCVSKLQQCFIQSVGCAPGKYIRHLRIEFAQNLLKQKKFTIAEVCEQVGFSSESVFCRCFHHEVGMSPTQYAASLQED